jgi:hypothetical protein
MLSASDQRTFSQGFSVWKTAGIEAFLLMLAILPLTPGFSEGLRYTAIFYQPPLNVVLVLACCFLGLLFLALLPLLWRAIRGLPAIEVTADMVTVYGTSGRSVAKSSISHLGEPKLGNSTLKVAGGRNLTLPIFLYKNSSESWRRIKALLSAG